MICHPTRHGLNCARRQADSPNRPRTGGAKEGMSMADGGDIVVSEWRTGWPILVAASLGMTMLGVGYLAAGTFIAPLEHEFGWGRGEIAASFLVFATTGGRCSRSSG
jgi:hypothetical protein